jgi:hypothetical protein
MPLIFPDDASGRVLRSLQAAGADMSAQYDVDFEHIFPDLGSAERFVEKVAARNGRTELTEHDGASGYYWQVRVVVRLLPRYASVTRVENELASLAESCGGRADGWGVMQGP